MITTKSTRKFELFYQHLLSQTLVITFQLLYIHVDAVKVEKESVQRKRQCMLSAFILHTAQRVHVLEKTLTSFANNPGNEL